MKTRFALLLVALCLGAGRVQAHHALFTVTPRIRQAGGIFFDVSAAAQAGGDVRFRIVITGNQAKLNRHPLTELGLLKDTRSARSIRPLRKVAAAWQGGSLVCTFTTDRKALADPAFCFCFSNQDGVFEDRILFAPDRDFVFARLRDFAPRGR